MKDISIEKDHLFYKSCRKISKIAAPIQEEFGIEMFRYMRAYSDRSRFILSDNKEIIERYFEVKHYNYEFVNFSDWPEEDFEGSSIWNGCNQGHQVCKYWQYFAEKFDDSCVFALYRKKANMVELFDFVCTSPNSHKAGILLTNVDVFKQFSYFFKEQAQDIIAEAEKVLFKPSRNPEQGRTRFLDGIFPGSKKPLIERLPVKRYYLTGEYEDVFVTYKELLCLKELIKGFTQEEIGKALDISRRTVEYRLNSLKAKLNCKNQAQLLEAGLSGELNEIINHLQTFNI